MAWLKQTGAATKIGGGDTGRSRSRRPGAAVQLQLHMRFVMHIANVRRYASAGKKFI